MCFLSTDEFLHSAQMVPQITLLEVDILFRLCDFIHPRKGFVPLTLWTVLEAQLESKQTLNFRIFSFRKITLNDLQILSPDRYFRHVPHFRSKEIRALSVSTAFFRFTKYRILWWQKTVPRCYYSTTCVERNLKRKASFPLIGALHRYVLSRENFTASSFFSFFFS